MSQLCCEVLKPTSLYSVIAIYKFRQLLYGAEPTENKLKIFVSLYLTLILYKSIGRNAGWIVDDLKLRDLQLGD